MHVHALRLALLVLTVPAGLLAQGRQGAPAAIPLPPAVARTLTGLPDFLVDAPTTARTYCVGRGYKANVAADGLEFLAMPGPTRPSQPLTLQLAHVFVGGHALELAAATKLADEAGPAGEHLVSLDHGALREHFAMRADGVEQSWTFAVLPRRGELELQLAVATQLAAAPRDGGIRFGGDEPGCVQYGAVTAIDADGRRLTVAPRFVDGTLRIHVPADFIAQASLPLHVDPLINAPTTIASGASIASGIDVQASWDEVNSRYLVVWSQPVSATDQDVYARRCNAAWLPVGSAVAVDVGPQDWANPTVAHRAATNEWLVAASRSRTSPNGFDVVARRMPFTGTAPAAFVVGGYNGAVTSCRPGLGGDPYLGAGGSWFLVVWTDPTGLQARTIDGAGTVGGATTIPGATGSSSVSRSDRSDRWLAAWVDGSSVRGALFDYTGVPIPVAGANSFLIGTTTTAGPLSVSALDRNNLFTVAWQSGTDVRLAAVSRTGTVGAIGSVAALDGPAGATPRIETDGVRACLLTGSANTLKARLLGYDTASATWLLQESLPVATSASGSMLFPGAVTSPFAEGTGTAITAVALVYSFADLLTASAHIVGYRGYAPTGGFSTFASACGTPPAFTRSGSPWLGSTVQFNLATAFPLVGFVFGTPASIPLSPICPCVLAVNGTLVAGSSLSITIPPAVSLVGQTFSTQGFSFEIGPCFGSASLTDTFDMVVQ